MTKDIKEFINTLIEIHLDDELSEWNDEEISKNSEQSIEMVQGCLKAWKAINIDRSTGWIRMMNEMILEQKMQRFGFMKVDALRVHQQRKVKNDEIL